MKLETYYKKYNLTPLSNKDIVNAIVMFEIGMTAGPIGARFWPDCPNRFRQIMVRKIIHKYSRSGTVKTKARDRRKYWHQHDLADFISDLNKKLVDDISIEAHEQQIKQELANEYKLANDNKLGDLINEKDIWFKHYTPKNILAYNAQKSMAKKRGVGWEFNSFEEWLLWWLQTGKFDQRGVNNEDYQMCRINDTGPYRWNNVYCDTGKNNKLHKGKEKPDQDTLLILESV